MSEKKNIENLNEERKQQIQAILLLLKSALIETHTSMAISSSKLVFFSTDDYLRNENIKDCDGFTVDINDLVK